MISRLHYETIVEKLANQSTQVNIVIDCYEALIEVEIV